MTNPKLTPEQRRKALYFKRWGLNEKNSTGDLRKVTPPKVDVDSITKSRIFLEKMRGDDNGY